LTFVIRGLGTAVPPLAMAQNDAGTLFFSFAEPAGGRERTLQALFRKSGVKKRHSVLLEREDGPLSRRQSFYHPARDASDQGPPTSVRMARYEKEAPSLAVTAAERALEEANTDPAAITHLVTVSCTGFFAPGPDSRLIETLGLPRSVERTHVGFMGCHGAMNGLRVGASHTGANPHARVLVCAVELCSLHVAYGWDPEDLVANAIFGDGAAAVVGRPALPEEIRALGGGEEGIPGSGPAPGGGPIPAPGSAEAPWTITANGTFLIPDSREAMSWRIGDHGFRMTLSPRVPDLIRAHLKSWLEGWLAREGVALEEVASWAIHPGGPRILGAVEEALALERSETEVAREVLAQHGNMSSPTILFILKEMRARKVARPLVALAFGPGLVVEAVLIR